VGWKPAGFTPSNGQQRRGARRHGEKAGSIGGIKGRIQFGSAQNFANQQLADKYQNIAPFKIIAS
jgi:hypothetical protein